MALWLVRAGSHGEFESKFIDEKRIYLTWDSLAHDISKLSDRSKLIEILETIEPGAKPKRLINHASQIWPFAHAMQKGDWVVLPLKSQTIYVGEITGDYRFEKSGPNPFYHWRAVEWIGEAIPRHRFGTDLLHSFGAFMTICSIKRNNAESRVKAMKAPGDWKEDPAKAGKAKKASPNAVPDDSGADDELNHEQAGLDRIQELIRARFAGHEFARLIEGILKAQGYTTYRSPKGPDGGIDILAGHGTLGFGAPQLCVEVKSEESEIDRSTVDKLLGAMGKCNAPQGLFVSWGGFKSNVQKELAQSFFKLRLWSMRDVLDALFESYDRLDPDLKAELPLKRFWTVVPQEE